MFKGFQAGHLALWTLVMIQEYAYQQQHIFLNEHLYKNIRHVRTLHEKAN